MKQRDCGKKLLTLNTTHWPPKREYYVRLNRKHTSRREQTMHPIQVIVKRWNGKVGMKSYGRNYDLFPGEFISYRDAQLYLSYYVAV